MMTTIIVVSNLAWAILYYRKCVQVGEVVERAETAVKRYDPRRTTDITINGEYRRL